MRRSVIVVHLQEFAGPHESLCGIRHLEIRRAKGLLVDLDKALKSNLRFRRGYKLCPDCANHPAIGMVLLRRLNDGNNAQD